MTDTTPTRPAWPTEFLESGGCLMTGLMLLTVGTYPALTGIRCLSRNPHPPTAYGYAAGLAFGLALIGSGAFLLRLSRGLKWSSTVGPETHWSPSSASTNQPPTGGSDPGCGCGGDGGACPT